MANLRLNQALSDWRQWPLSLGEQPRVLQQLAGFTNQSFVLESGSQKLVLRLNRANATSLGINRNQEYLIWQAVASLGIAPELLHVDHLSNYVIYQFVEGRTWNQQDFRNPDQLQRLADVVSRYQQPGIDITPRNYVDYLGHYWKQLENAATPDPQLIIEWNQFIPRLEAFQQSGWAPVLSHHDLIPENIIDNGQQLLVVDWEYAALGHPDLDWSTVTGEQIGEIGNLIDWTNRLWWLLAGGSGGLNTGS